MNDLIEPNKVKKILQNIKTEMGKGNKLDDIIINDNIWKELNPADQEVAKRFAQELNKIGVFSNDNNSLKIFNLLTKQATDENGFSTNLDTYIAGIFKLADAEILTKGNFAAIVHNLYPSSLASVLVELNKADPDLLTKYRDPVAKNDSYRDQFSLIRILPQITDPVQKKHLVIMFIEKNFKNRQLDELKDIVTRNGKVAPLPAEINTTVVNEKNNAKDLERIRLQLQQINKNLTTYIDTLTTVIQNSDTYEALRLGKMYAGIIKTVLNDFHNVEKQYKEKPDNFLSIEDHKVVHLITEQSSNFDNILKELKTLQNTIEVDDNYKSQL